MNRFKSVTITKPLRWFMALLLVAFVAGCGGGGSGSSAGSSAPSSAKAITAYSLAGITGRIDETAKTIVVTVPSGTSVTAQVATFSAPGASVTVSGVAQTSGVTANNFTIPVVYMVTAANGTTAIYAVTVVPNPAIIAFSLAGVKGTINETAKTIAVTVPYVTNVNIDPTAIPPHVGLAAAFSAPGASVTVSGVAQTSGVTMNDFTNPVRYIVTAADSTTATYTVTVTRALNPNKTITSYSLDGIPGTIDPTNPTISVPMPYGKNITALVATFTTTGASVKVGSLEQQSLVTTNDFTNPVAYTVTAVDGTTTTYTVTVNQALSSDKAITSYALAGATGTITGGASPFAIAVTVPIGTNLTGLAATFTTTGASVKVGSLEQVSVPAVGATLNDFSNSVATPVAYVVTAADSTTATYKVTVTVVAGPNLRSTASFAVLAGTVLTTTAPNVKTTVTGDVGATSETINGTLAINGGTDLTGTPTYTTAMSDLTLVIAELADETGTALYPCGSTIAGGDLNTVILTPGVSCAGANAISNSGTVTLNGSGLYIIRTNAALTAAVGSKVAYTGGATDLNTTVFWVVISVDFTSSAGSPVIWKGNLVATTGAVTLGDSATLTNGRVLTTTAVNLTNNTITKP
jgi:hypothetical protein